MHHRLLGIIVLLLALAWSMPAEAQWRPRRGPPPGGFGRPPTPMGHPPGHYGPPPRRHGRPPVCTGQGGSCGLLDDLRSVTETETGSADNDADTTTETTNAETTGSDSTGSATTDSTTTPRPTTDSGRKKESGTSLDVPFLYQYDNSTNGGGSCQNTSVAMVLAYFGVNVDPDTISNSSFGTSTAKSPAGAARVFNHYAAKAGISERMTGHRDGSFADLKAELDKGNPVVVNGYFTAGHVLVVTGYDDNGYYVNDPAGTWKQTWKGGYAGQSTKGKGVYYGKAAFEQAVGTWDGSTPAPLYYTTIN